MRAVKQRNSFAKEVVSSPALEVFNSQLEKALRNLVSPAADPVCAGGWTNDLLRSLPVGIIL